MKIIFEIDMNDETLRREKVEALKEELKETAPDGTTVTLRLEPSNA
jgi:hypothetical protein